MPPEKQRVHGVEEHVGAVGAANVGQEEVEVTH